MARRRSTCVDQVFVNFSDPIEHPEHSEQPVPTTMESLQRGLDDFHARQQRVQEARLQMSSTQRHEFDALNAKVWAGWEPSLRSH